MRVMIRGLTLILALAVSAGAQQKNPEQAIGVVSGVPVIFYDNYGSGTLTLTYSFTGTPSGVSIAVQGCAADGTTCTTLTPISGANPYVTAASGQQQYTGGYANYKVTPTFSGATLNIYKVGIQAKLTSPGGGGGGAPTTNPAGGQNNYAGTDSLTTETSRATTAEGNVQTYATNPANETPGTFPAGVILPIAQTNGILPTSQTAALTGDITKSAGSASTVLAATTNSTLTTLSALSLPQSQVTGLGTFATQNYATPPTIGGTTPGIIYAGVGSELIGDVTASPSFYDCFTSTNSGISFGITAGLFGCANFTYVSGSGGTALYTAAGWFTSATTSYYYTSGSHTLTAPLYSSSNLLIAANGSLTSYSTMSATASVTTKSFITTTNAVTTSATPALNASYGLQTIQLSANATPTISGINSGARYTIEICQPASGGPYTWTWPATVHGGMTIGSTASTCSIQAFDSFNGTTLVAESAGITGVAP